MISIDEASVDSAAPNAEAAKNGRGLVLKNKFVKLHITEDGTLLFGECEGSGKEPYRCSCDFQRPEAPTHRCSCPSRQFPCKHCLGLMYAYVQGKKFTKAEVPEDLQAKREKLQARAKRRLKRSKSRRKWIKVRSPRRFRLNCTGSIFSRNSRVTWLSLASAI